MTQKTREPLPADLFPDPRCSRGPRPFRVGDKWSALVLRCLEGGPRRFTELRVPLHHITAKVLTQTLRAMERDGFLTRTAYDENPPRVEYELTPLGRALIVPLDTLCAWTRDHLPQLTEARAAWSHFSAEAGNAGAGEPGEGRACGAGNA
ncbi:helix-turn-helix transcriptional regulator [Streptomyces sp. NBC_01317]|uniref:winged helix-turn-helix transcriptional regulator n=1 Tax=Streptomyces sp. NBC_01317 TaxID=2903822 RepID=UPI002E0EA34F|nr:helix-turn-helix transcriptional regulator [Streptomyces sp. NBC_01317]